MKINSRLQKDRAEVRKLTRHMAITIAPLEADLNFAANQWAKDTQSQFWRRTVIRCHLAVAEALLWNMKHIAAKIACISGLQLTQDELEVAHEERVVMVNGKPERRPKFLKFRDNLKASFSLFSKVHGVRAAERSGPGFDAFCETYELRSRLMHPKGPFDPNVSDDDIATAQRGGDWFGREYRQLMQRCEEAAPKIARGK